MQTDEIQAVTEGSLLVGILGEYLEEIGKSARWFGWTVAADPRLIPNLRRGQRYPASVMLKIWKRLLDHYERLPVHAEAELPLAA